MSTVTTHLCQYDDLSGRTLGAARATEARVGQMRTRDKDTIAKVEQLLTEGVKPTKIIKELGIERDGRRMLRRMFSRNERPDLVAAFVQPKGRKPSRPWYAPGGPRCARKDCAKPAIWVEDKGLDEGDEPIAHWGYLCFTCQRFEDLCEDLEFLLDPKRGNETDLCRLVGRLGFKANYQGVESLRQALTRGGRLDLRDMLQEVRLKRQRGWHLQGTLHTSSATYWTRNADFVLAANGLERAVHKYGMLA